MRLIRFDQNGGLTRYKRLTQFVRRRRSVGRQDEPKPTLFVTYVEHGSPALSPANLREKTVTVRHRETPEREDKLSEGHLVMRWIAVAILPQAKAALTFVRCLMARKILEPMN